MPKGKPRSKASLIDRRTPILLTQTHRLPTNAEKTPSGDINLPKLDCIHGACKKDIYIPEPQSGELYPSSSGVPRRGGKPQANDSALVIKSSRSNPYYS